MFQSPCYVTWLSVYYSSNGPAVEQEAETGIPVVVKHCFSEALGMCMTKTFLCFKRDFCVLADCSLSIMDAPHALPDAMILQKRFAHSCCLSNIIKGNIGIVCIPRHLN